MSGDRYSPTGWCVRSGAHAMRTADPILMRAAVLAGAAATPRSRVVERKPSARTGVGHRAEQPPKRSATLRSAAQERTLIHALLPDRSGRSMALPMPPPCRPRPKPASHSCAAARSVVPRHRVNGAMSSSQANRSREPPDGMRVQMITGDHADTAAPHRPRAGHHRRGRHRRRTGPDGRAGDRGPRRGHRGLHPRRPRAEGARTWHALRSRLCAAPDENDTHHLCRQNR